LLKFVLKNHFRTWGAMDRQTFGIRWWSWKIWNIDSWYSKAIEHIQDQVYYFTKIKLLTPELWTFKHASVGRKNSGVLNNTLEPLIGGLVFSPNIYRRLKLQSIDIGLLMLMLTCPAPGGFYGFFKVFCLKQFSIFSLTFHTSLHFHKNKIRR